MREMCLAYLVVMCHLEFAITQRWRYDIASPYTRNTWNDPYKVAGWTPSTTTEPTLGPNDRINTTDVPEEIEARPDLTRPERRQLLRQMNPGSTSQQIETQLARDDEARARMAATQSEPIAQHMHNDGTRSHHTSYIPGATLSGECQDTRGLQRSYPRSGQTWSHSRRSRLSQRYRKRQRMWLPRQPLRITTATRGYAEPPPTTYPPTYPTTTYPYPPTTYPTTEYNYYEPMVTNTPRRRMPPRRQRPGGPRTPSRNRNGNRPPSRNGRRRQGRRGRMNGEEFVPRDPITRWLFNNMDGEGLESLLPLFALG